MFLVYVIPVFVVILAPCFVLAQGQKNGEIVTRSNYLPGPFESLKGPEKMYAKEVYEAAVKDTRFVMERLRYSSDGITVSAYLYRPTSVSGKTPVVIFNRGGYIRDDIGGALVPLFHRLAEKGFVILAPMYRGSDGATGKDEVGGNDVNDLMNVLPLIRTLNFMDSRNVFLYGESRGGMMVYQALRDGFPANAAATVGSFSDFRAFISVRPEMYLPLLRSIWNDYDARQDEIARRRSAVLWADKINVPLLLMHGGADRAVDPQQVLNFAQALQKLNKKYALMIYADDDHILTANQDDRDARAAQWFKMHLK